MIKPECLSYCEEKGKIDIVCPKCGSVGAKATFNNDTSLYIYSIRLKQIHNHHFAVCTNCKNVFEVAK